MAKSNVNDYFQNALGELKDMSGILSSKVGESVKDKTKAKVKQDIVDGIKEGVKDAKNISVDVSNKIDVDTKSIEKNTSKQVANALNNGIKSAQSQIKSITISPKITISPEDIDYAKIKRELDKELKKANQGTSVNNKRYLDLMQTSDDIGNFLAPKYYDYRDVAKKQVGDYSPKNIIQEFVDATKIIEQQNRIWQQAIEYLLKYQSAAKNAAKANRDILPYQGDNTSIYIDGMDTTKNSGYRNVTQKSLKAHLKDYIANPSQENFDVLAAYTNAFGNIQKAEEIFGKKHAKLFSQIIEYIEQAKISTNDYKEAQVQLKLALQSLGVESIKLGQFDRLYDILSGQDLKAGAEYIEKELGIEIPKAVKEAFDSGDITSFLHSIKQVEEEVDKTEEELNETAEAGEKAKRAVQWIRGETGGADIQQDAYTEAINKFTNVKVRNSVDADGNPQTETAQYVNMDKLAKEIIKHDTEILNLEYRIKNAQGDTSGLEENLGILKQQRSEYERFLDDKIADPYYETNESQKEILLQQRAINEEMIRNEQYTKDVVIQEKERVRLKEEQKKLYIQMQEASSAKQVEQEKVKQQNLNILLSEQRQAYKNIYNIKTSIAKLDPTKNALEIAELERQKKIEVEIYGEKTRAIKAIDAQAHAEAHVNELYDIRKKALNEIAQIQSRKLDKSSANVQEQETKASAKAAEAEAEAIAKRNKERRKLQDKANLNVADTHNKEAIALYQTLIKQADEYYTLLEQEKRGELEGNKTAQNRLAELKIAWEKATQGVEEYSTAVKGSTTYIDKLDAVRSIFRNSDQGVALDYSKSLQDMEKNLRAIADGDKYIASIKEEAKGLAEQIHKINSEPIDLKADGAIEDIAKLNGDYQEFLNKIETSDAKVAAQDTIAKLDVQIEEFMQKNSKMGRQFRQEFESLKIRLDASESKQEVKDVVTELNRLKASVYEANKTGKSFFANLGNRIRQMSTNFLAMYLSLYDVVRYARTAYETIKQLDTALVDLKKTTTMSNSELEEFYMNSSNIAKQMGTSTEQIISQAAAWSRLGYSSKEAATEMAALSSQFAAISPGTSVDNATDYLVSTMKAFHVAVENVESDIMDPINRLGNTMATSNQEIGEMLKRSSAAMAAANNSLAETAALESAAVQITRNAETTGTAFRTISMRIRGYDEETEEFIGNVEQLSGDIADLTKTAKNSGGISLFTDETKSTYKSTYQLLKEIAGIWDDLSDKQQAGLLEKLAGKRGGQVLAGILDDFSEVERAMSEIEKSAGSADKEMGIIEEKQNSLYVQQCA